VYALPVASLAATPAEPVEDQPFRLTVTVRNPSDFELRDVRVQLLLPPGLDLLAGSSGFTLPLLGPQSEARRELTMVSADPLALVFPAPEVTFLQGNSALTARATELSVVVGDDIAVRYGAPLAIAAALAVGAILLMRRKMFAAASGGPDPSS
jgi:hypothetical protein